MRARSARLLAGGSAALAAGVALMIATASPAGAHAELVSTDPADGARLGEAPAAVVLQFSENVGVTSGGVRAYDRDGRRVDEGRPTVEGHVVRLELRDGLAGGSYAVTYRVTSADGHPVRGGLVFSVGDAVADRSLLARFFDADDDRPSELAGALARAVGYWGALLAAGGGAYLVLIDPGTAERARLHRTVRGAAVVGVAGLVAGTLADAALATGRGLDGATDWRALRNVLDEGAGAALTVTAVGLALLCGPRRIRFLVPGAVLAAGGFALAGHTRTTDPAWVAYGADAAHVGAVALWFGGLVLLARALHLRSRAPASDPGVSAALVARFSTGAAAALAVVAASGAALGWAEVRAVSALTSTNYGQVLLTKVALVAVVVAIAAYNRFELVPQVRNDTPRGRHRQHDDDDDLRRVGWTVRAEAALLVVVLAVTAVLVNETPARVEAGVGGGPVTATVDLGPEHGTVDVVVDPSRAGRNELHLYFFDPGGRAHDVGGGTVTVRLSLPSADIGPLQRTPEPAGEAHFVLIGDELAVAGQWTVEVDLRFGEFDQATGSAQVRVRG